LSEHWRDTLRDGSNESHESKQHTTPAMATANSTILSVGVSHKGKDKGNKVLTHSTRTKTGSYVPVRGHGQGHTCWTGSVMYSARTRTGSLVSSSRTMTGSHVDSAKTRTAQSMTQDESKDVATHYDSTMYDNDTVTKSDHI
jgi:hypothetical protein